MRGLCACLLSILAATGAAQAQGELFYITAEALSPDFPGANKALVEARAIEIDASQLAAGRERIRFKLFRGTQYEAVLSELERRGPADVTWRGWLGEPGTDRVVLTLQGGHVAGMVFSPEGVHEIAPLAGGRHRLAKLDQDRFPECGGALPPRALTVGTAADAPVISADPADQIDVMIAYTPQARNAAGGTAAIQATAQSAVDMANTAFTDSDMDARFHLVATVLANRNDSGDMVSDLYWLAADAAIAAARDVSRADLVSLLVESGQACGVGFVMQAPGPSFAGSAFQVTALSCAVGNLSWAHEHGHNMGMEHNPENGSLPSSASYLWSFGHYVNGVFRTVMSYDSCANGCPRVARFSNPDLTYAGQPTGITDQRDNSRTGDLTAPIAANFRTRALGGFYTVTPCRLFDSRQAGQGELTSGASRTFGAAGSCGIPASAAALVANVTIVQPSATGHVTLQPGSPYPSSTSTINFAAGQTRANNTILPIAANGAGTLTIQPALLNAGTVHVIVDVSGYFD